MMYCGYMNKISGLFWFLGVIIVEKGVLLDVVNLVLGGVEGNVNFWFFN